MATAWLTDANGNRASVEYFRSAEAAQKALDSLTDCKNCINCSDCSDCINCSYCLDCSDCSDCSGDVGDFTSPAIPKIEDIHKRVYAAASEPDALDMGSWHTCGTTHCRAGWVVHLAGEAGYALERFHSTALAAQLIYKASGYEISPVKFYVKNEEALEDMRALAEG